MKRFWIGLIGPVMVGGILTWINWEDQRSQAQAPQTEETPRKETPQPGEAPKPDLTVAQAAKKRDVEAGIKAITTEYTKAFNAADATAAANLWTANGEYEGPDGQIYTGREAIAKSLAEFFKENPKIQADIRVESVKLLAGGLANAVGVVSIKAPGRDAVTESKYNALHVFEDGVWRTASVREWVPDPTIEVTLQQLDWLVGEWKAKGPGGTIKMVFAWDQAKTFLEGKYTISNQDKVISSGNQILGRNPEGGLRSWTFDSSGTTSEAIWVKDETRWVCEGTGQLADGTEISSVNVMIPLTSDKFTWQTTERTINGVEVQGLPPVKVTRVKTN